MQICKSHLMLKTAVTTLIGPEMPWTTVQGLVQRAGNSIEFAVKGFDGISRVGVRRIWGHLTYYISFARDTDGPHPSVLAKLRLSTPARAQLFAIAAQLGI